MTRPHSALLPALRASHLLLATLAGAAASPLHAQGGAGGDTRAAMRGDAAPAASCRASRAAGVVAGLVLGAGAAWFNYQLTILGAWVLPASPDAAEQRAVASGALLGLATGLSRADASDACRRADGTAPAAGPRPGDGVVPGVKVRLTAPALGPGRATRWVVGRRADTLLLAADRRGGADTVAVALGDATGLEVARRRRGPHAAAAVLTGAAVGAVIGGAIGYHQAAPDPSCGIVCEATPMQEALLGGYDGALAGAAVGLLAARARLGESWEPISVGPRPATRQRVGIGVGVAPTPGGVAVAVTVRPRRR